MTEVPHNVPTTMARRLGFGGLIPFIGLAGWLPMRLQLRVQEAGRTP